MNLLLGPIDHSGYMAGVFTDEAIMRDALRFETALAHACAATGLISRSAGEAIATAADALALDPEQIASHAAESGTLAIPLVSALREKTQTISSEGAAAVHMGSTSQDLADTVLALRVREATVQLISRATPLCAALARNAKTHRQDPMLGRTLLRGALATTLGLTNCQWLMGITESLQTLKQDTKTLSLQLGGPVGTRAGYAGKGAQVSTHMASTLELPNPLIPWHTRRHPTARIATSLVAFGQALSKCAMDIALLGQDELGEVLLELDPGRGGSSAMPHKQNPTSAQQCLSAAQRLPGIAQHFLTHTPHTFERGLAGWQAELSLLRDLFIWTDEATTAAGRLLHETRFQTSRMESNLHAAKVGTDFGEAAQLVDQIIAHYEEHPL